MAVSAVTQVIFLNECDINVELTRNKRLLHEYFMNCNYPQANSQHIKQNKNVSIADSIQRAFKTEFAVRVPLCLKCTTVKTMTQI